MGKLVFRLLALASLLCLLPVSSTAAGRVVLIGVDGAIGEIAAALDEEDAVVVASDHGFQARDGYRRAGIPDDLEDRLPVEWLDPDALAARPPRAVAAANLRRLPAPAAPEVEGGDRAVIERLRSMGWSSPADGALTRAAG